MVTQQDASELQPFEFSTSWPSSVKPHDLKSDPIPFDTTQSAEYWQRYRSLAGSPFDSSDSDSSSDCGDDALSVLSLNLPPVFHKSPLSKDVSLIDWEDIETPEIMGSNALGLIFMSGEDVFEAKEVPTFTQQAESLRAPRNHQDVRSCDRPDQKHQMLQEHLAFQSDSPTDETLVRKFPQDIGLPSDVSDSFGSKVSKRNNNKKAVPS